MADMGEEAAQIDRRRGLRRLRVGGLAEDGADQAGQRLAGGGDALDLQPGLGAQRLDVDLVDGPDHPL
jgi:hypothetical protein